MISPYPPSTNKVTKMVALGLRIVLIPEILYRQIPHTVYPLPSMENRILAVTKENLMKYQTNQYFNIPSVVLKSEYYGNLNSTFTIAELGAETYARYIVLIHSRDATRKDSYILFFPPLFIRKRDN